jgi:hypothetical protein
MRILPILALFLLIATAQLSASPSIKAIEPNFTFPTVTAGDLVKHSFIITNTGTSVLVISNVLTSCGCTTANNWTTKIEPGATGTIPIIFNSFNYSGEVSKMVTILSNDPKQPAILVRFNGKVFKPLSVEPSFLLMALTPDQTGTGEAKILNQTAKAIQIKEIRPGNTAFTTILKTNKPGFSYSLSITAKPPYSQGYQTAIRIFTDDERELSFIVLANAPAALKQN